MSTQREQLLAALVWDDRAEGCARMWGLARADVEAIIRHDPQPVTDPHASDVGYPILRYRRGDVVVVVGFRYVESPKVLYVHTVTDQESRGDDPKWKRVASGGPGSDLPTSHRDLKRRILGLGFRFEIAGNGHLAVIDKATGERLCGISSTPSTSSSVADDWKQFRRAYDRRR